MAKFTALALLFSLTSAALAGDEKKPVLVFILAGQSNMEGKAKVSVMEYQAKQPATRDRYKHLYQDGQWKERADVWIKYRGHAGNLAVGYGSPKMIGPELEFGTVVGDHYPQQVLLIKTAWGGRSLYRDFRSPSAGYPPDKILEAMLKEQQKKKPTITLDDIKKPFGATYREMMADVTNTLANLKKHFPAYADQGHELGGFIWFQGWNDMISPAATEEYTANLKHLINDVRKDLKSPKLPFVIGEMGVDGVKADGGIKKFKEAQAGVMKEPAFKGNVALVKTDLYWDTEAEAVFKKGWRENLDEWNKVGSDFPYHYLGSPKTMMGIGRALGQAVLQLREAKQ